MNCQGVIRELSSYLDGDMEAVAVTELEIHLQRCQDCRIIVDTTRKTIEIYCKSQPVPLPADVRTRLHEALWKRIGRRPTA